MDKLQIMEILPHRNDMLLIDEAYKNEDGSSTAYYTVRGDEFFLNGHFPGYPVVPGVILCEMIAQSACVIMGDGLKGKTPFYTGINKVRFRSQARPGDKLRFECRLLRSKGVFYFMAGKAYVGDRLCAEGEFSFAVQPAAKE
ncbi:MAG: beta-hydroxyacyl-ACP dehydratase [Clostridia bacterium]|nr:beta-hydroxyacyl-ACP dehydratase [Clostridia bacterium]